MNTVDDLDDAVIVALGGNQSWGGTSVQAVLDAALARFAAAGLQVVKPSGWWRSQAWPDPSQPPFLNGVALVRTASAPPDVMSALLSLERDFGRERLEPNAARTLDLDLIAYGRRVGVWPGLVLPHPRAAERLFVMGPLAEIAPGWIHPALGRSALELAKLATVGRDAAPVETRKDQR